MAVKKSQRYASLWQSCDELRGGMDASQYKDYVLVMLFVRMSQLLDELVCDLRAKRLGHKAYLNKIAELAAKATAGIDDRISSARDTPGERPLYANLGEYEPKALLLHDRVMEYRTDGWRGHPAKERALQGAIYGGVGEVDETKRVFELIKKQLEY